MNEKIKKSAHYFIAPGLVLFIFLVLLILKKIYPFGDNLIGSVNIDDIFIPMFYKMYDILHGTADFFFDFKLGGGTDLTSIMINVGIFNPINWLIYIVPRDFIPYMLSYIVILKLVIASFIAYYSLNKIFTKVDKTYTILSSIIYTLSGYTLLTYYNINHLDVMMFLPLLVLGLKKIFDGKNSKLFLITLSISLIFNYKLAFTLILFIFVGSILFAKTKEENKRSKILNKIFLDILIAFGLTAFIFLPANFVDNYGFNEINYYKTFILERILYFLPMAFSLIFFIKQLTNYKNDKKYSRFYIEMTIIFLIALFIPAINKSLVDYFNAIYSYGYIFIFMIILGSLHYLQNNPLSKETKNNNYLLFIFTNMILFYIAYTFKDVVMESNLSVNIEFTKQFIAMILIFIIGVVLIYIATITNPKYRKYFICYSQILLILIFGSFYIKTSDVSESLNTKKVEVLEESIYRYKDNTGSLGANMSAILKIPSLSNEVFSSSKDNQKNYKLLGYLTNGNISYSAGGTFFTDMILGNKYVMSYQELEDEYYNLIKKENSIYYYELKNSLDFAIPYNYKEYNEYEKTTFSYQNKIYQILFDKEDNLFEEVSPNVKLNDVKVTEKDYFYPVGENNSVEFSIDIKDRKAVYLNIDHTYGNFYNITVNDKVIKNPVLTDKQNTKFPVSEQKLLYLGTFENEKVNVIMYTEGIEIKEFLVGMMDVNKYKDLSKESLKTKVELTNNTLNISIENDDSYDALFIPINYLDNYIVTNNDKYVSYLKNINNYISIDLKEGKNNITIKYDTPYILTGTIISSITLGIYIFLNKSKKKQKRA